MARYLDPKNDLPFKKVFGEHKHLLISFLNALLPLQKGQEIVSIEYLTSEQAPRTPVGKNSIVDVKCVDNSNRYFIVEMQMAWSQQFANRLIFNASKAFVQQFDKKTLKEKARTFSKACPVYSLAIVNSELPKLPSEEKTKWYHHYKIAEMGNPERVIEGLEFVIVELPKFKPATWSQTDKRMAVLWLRFLKELEASETVAEELLQEEEIKEAISICEVGAFTKEELAYYDECLVIAMWDATYGELEETIAEQSNALAEKENALAEKDAEMAKLREIIAQLKR
jgi:predicted transposase/invertase (TIGR01784 family)